MGLLVFCGAIQAKADTAVALDHATVSCTQSVGFTIIDGKWLLAGFGDVEEGKEGHDVFANWTCYPAQGLGSYKMTIFYNNSSCKCLAVWSANDSAFAYEFDPGPPPVWLMRDGTNTPYTLSESGVCIL